jgi:hypothetical protein
VITALLQQPAQEVVLAAPANQTGESPVPDPLIIIAVSFFLLWFVGWLGGRISWVKKFDNVIRVVIVVLGIIFPASVIPFLRDFFTIGSTLLNAGTSNTNLHGVAFAGFTVVILGLAAVGAWIVYGSEKKELPKNAMIMLLLSGFFFLGLPWVQEASTWYVNNVAINFFWAFFLGVYRYGEAHHIMLS